MEEIEDEENEDLVIFECEPIAHTRATREMSIMAWWTGQIIMIRYPKSPPPSNLTPSGKKWVKYFQGSTSLDDLNDSEELKFKTKVENFLNALKEAKVWKFSTQGDLNNAYKWGLFNWNKIPGKHNKKLKKFLRNNFNVDWVKSFKKSEDNKSITASEGENHLLITLDKETATLKIDSKTDETFEVKKKKAMLRIVIDRGYAITSTYRPKERSYLMHYSWKIAKGRTNPKNVPGFEGGGVNIEWWHGDQDTSIKAAKEMIDGYKIRGGAALKSRHNSGRAIDLVLRWRVDLNIKNSSGKPVLITSRPRTHRNKELWKVAESYEVIHFKCSEKRITSLMKRKIMKKRDPWHEKLCIRGEFQHWSDDGS